MVDRNTLTAEEMRAFIQGQITGALGPAMDAAKNPARYGTGLTGETAFQRVFVNYIHENGKRDGIQYIDADEYTRDDGREQATGADIELFWRSSATEKTTCFLQIKKVYNNPPGVTQTTVDSPYFGLSYRSQATNLYQAVTLANTVSNAVKRIRANNVGDLPPNFDLGAANSRHIVGGYLLVNIITSKVGFLRLLRIGAVLGGITTEIIDRLTPQRVTELYRYRIAPASIPSITAAEEISALRDFRP